MDENQLNQPQQQPQPQAVGQQPPVSGKPKSSGSKKLILVVIALLVIGVGTAMVLQGSDKSTTKTAQPTASVTQPQTVASVQITAGAFVPASVKIKAGSAVKWSNEDTAQHRIAADPYLTHSSFPELDSKEPLDAQDTFTFTFSKAGTYTYHDELNPSKYKGTVIVE